MTPQTERRGKLVPPVQRIEMVSGPFSEPVEPMWRVMVDKYCIDFETETAANNVRNAILSLPSSPAPEGMREAERIILGNQLAMMCALHQLMRGFLAPDPLAQERLSARISATRVLTSALTLPSSPALDKERVAARANLQEAWAALSMIRETVETLAPSGSVKAAEHLDGPTFMHEADALVAGIRALPTTRPIEPEANKPGGIES